MKAAGSCGCFHRLASTNPLFSWHNGRKLQTFPFCCSLIKASSSLLRHKLAQALRGRDPTGLCLCRWGGQWVAMQPGSRNPPSAEASPRALGSDTEAVSWRFSHAGSWAVARCRGFGSKLVQNPAKPPRNACWELPGSEGFLGCCRGASAGVGLHDFCSADFKMSGKNWGQHMLGFALFSLRGLLLRWPKKALAVRPLFPKSNAHNNSRTDGSWRRRWHAEVRIDFAVVFILLKNNLTNPCFSRISHHFVFKWGLKERDNPV